MSTNPEIKIDEVCRSTHFNELVKSWTTVKAIAACKPHQVVDYWKALITADTLKYRLCNTEHPGKDDVVKLLTEPFVQSFYVWDKFQKKLTAEFMLENFTGKAAQIHVSVLPSNNSAYSLEIARWVSEDILNKWTMSSDKTEPYLKTLFGLTPMPNRAARLFICRAGFKAVGVIPNAMMNFGKIVDALLTVKTGSKT